MKVAEWNSDASIILCNVTSGSMPTRRRFAWIVLLWSSLGRCSSLLLQFHPSATACQDSRLKALKGAQLAT